ncbi:MAG: hypothetical protein EXR71_04020 [Myxococcales bacterium]|nr:hypothetical protein [Myxococcales bacterium]
MVNLLIAGGAALVAFAIGFYAAGWIAGVVPALIAMAAVWFILARRTGKKVEAIAMAAMSQLQAGNMAGARETLRTALPLGRWQVLVEAQIHAQVGAVDYLEACSMLMQRQITAAKSKFADAKTELEKSWSRDWRSRTLLACVHHRENNTDQAVVVLGKAESVGSREVMFWAVWAYILNEAKRRDAALKVVGRGLASLPKHAGLVALQEALSNKKRPDFKVFGEAWYQFFPEHIPQEVLMEQARAAGKLPPGANRSPKTWPQPRR